MPTSQATIEKRDEVNDRSDFTKMNYIICLDI